LSNGKEKSASGAREQVVSTWRKALGIEGEVSNGFAMKIIASGRHLTQVGDRAGLAETDYP
jgi:hypothetical protein